MKTRRALSLFLVVAMILSMFTMILPASAVPGETRTGIYTRSRTVYTYYSDEQLMDMFHVDLETLQRMSYDARYAYLHNEEWDVRPYAIQRDSVEADALFQVLYRQPECFAVIRFSYSYDSNDNLAYVKPLYTNGYEVAMEQHSALMDAVQEIMCLFQRAELTELELAILVHDYLAANFEYHYPTLNLPLEQGKYSAYNLLVEGTAVCQGYAEAFALIMMQFGIHCGLCQSDTLNHAWSILELDGKEYHVDVTWDDPSYDMYGKVSHEFFLISTDDMNSHEDHYADDFTATPNNKEFDTAFWQDIESSFCLLDNTIYYIGTTGKTSGALYTWKDGVSTRLLDLNYTWSAGENSYWPGCYSRLITDGEKLFYSTPNEIIAYEPATGKSESIYTYVNAENPYCYIYGFNIKDNNLYINVHHTPVYTTLDAKTENTIIHPYRAEAVENHVFGDPVFTTFPCETDGEARYDCIYCGFSKFETIPAAGHTEEPLTGKAATCTEDGLTDGTVCSVCGETIQEQETIPAPGHTEEPIPGNAATCTEDGLTDGAVCSVCGDTIQKQEPIPATGHDWLDATCTAPITCSICGEEQAGETGYILQDPTIYVPQNGDRLVIAVENGGVYTSMTDTLTSKKLESKDITVSDGKISSNDLIVWTIESVSNGYALKVNDKYLAYDSSTNFKMSNDPYQWNMTIVDNGYRLTASGDASRDIYYQTSGNRFGPYSNKNSSGYVTDLQFFKYAEGGGALGHTEEVIPGTPATCTVDGLTDGIVCSVCGETIREQEAIKAPGHTEVTVPGKEATCIEDGLTDGIKCSVCGETIREQETIDAHGHTAKEVEGSAPTCTEDGKSAHTVCEVCGEALSEVETTPALGHDEIYDSNNDGTHTITCSRGDLSETAECSYTNGVCDFCDYEEPVVEVVSYKLITLDNIKEGNYIIGAVRDAEYPSIYPATGKMILDKSNSDWLVSDTAVTAIEDVITSDQLPEDAQVFVLSGDNTNGFTIGFELNGEMQYLGYTSTANRRLAFGPEYNSTLWTIENYKEGFALINSSYKIYQNSTKAGAIRGYANTQTAAKGIYLFAQVVQLNPENCPHASKITIEKQDPTCLNFGYIKWECADCGTTGEDTLDIAPENHTPVAREDILQEASCMQEGLKEIITICSICNAELSRAQEAIPLAPHTYEEGFCTVCIKDAPGKTFYLVSDPLDLEAFVLYHPASGTALSLNPSDNKLMASKVTVENGVLTTVEDTAVFRRIQPLDNEFPLRITDYIGAILTSGETKGNLLYTTEESAYGSWKPVVVSAEDRTFRFENQGSGLALQFYKDQFSVYAGDGEAYIFQIYNSIPVCDHQWDDGVQVKDPTCKEPGQMLYTCTVCGDITVEILPTTEHAWQVDTTEEPTCTEDGIIHCTCSNCGETKEETIPSKGHSMDEGTVTTEPTCTENGVKTFTCTACGLEKTEVVPATGHTMEDDTCTVCGYTKPVVKAGQYVIAANVNGTYYAMDNTFASKIAGTSITLTDGKIHEDHAEGFVVTLSEVEGGWTIQNPDGSYLKYASGTNLGNSKDPYVWTFTEGTNGTWRASAQDESRGLVFRTEDSSKKYNQFGGYAVSNITATGTQYYDIELVPVIPAPDAELTNRSISLNGNIAVNFYMSLSDKVVADPDAYMLFKQEGKVDENGNEITVKVTVAECVPKQVRGRTSYVFTYEVAAKEMTDTITAQFFYGDTCTEEYTYSVKTYADNQRQNLSADKNLMNLLDAMLHYGAASQLQFDYHIERLADAGMEKVDYSGVTIDGYPLNLPQGTDLVTFAGASLLLESETTLRYFFLVDPSVENLVVTYNGTPLEILYRGGMYCVNVKDISAPALDKEFTITVNDGVQEANVTYSPLTYCQSIRNKDTSTEVLKDVCAALYLYNQAANAFFEPAE